VGLYRGQGGGAGGCVVRKRQRSSVEDAANLHSRPQIYNMF
jgi:hypothetical protein